MRIGKTHLSKPYKRPLRHKANPLNRYIRHDKRSEAKLRRCAMTKGREDIVVFIPMNGHGNPRFSEFVIDVMRKRIGYGNGFPQCPSVRYR